MKDINCRGFELTLHEPGIALIEFNRPEVLNASTHGLKRDLVEVLTQAQMDDDVRVVVFTGTGRGFMAGDQLVGPEGESTALMPPIEGGHLDAIGTYDALRVLSQSLNSAIRRFDKLTIAAVNGFAIQTGLSLALSCDFRIAAESAKLGSATLRMGLLPDEGGHFLLVQHLGLGRAMDFMMRKRIVTASEAAELGLVSEVVPDGELRARAMALATELAEGPQVAMRFLKRSLYIAAETTWENALEDIAALTAASDHHPDAAEGVKAFFEKRTPQFNQVEKPAKPSWAP